MFETVESAEIPIPPIFGTTGERHWAYVRQRLHMHWFHVTFALEIEHGNILSNMLFLSRVEQLQQAVQEQDIEIQEVNIVLPGHMSGKDMWTMEPLAEVWQGIEPEAEGQRAYIYVIGDGTRHTDSGLNTNEADLLNKELIYSASMTGSRTRR